MQLYFEIENCYQPIDGCVVYLCSAVQNVIFVDFMKHINILSLHVFSVIVDFYCFEMLYNTRMDF